MEEGALSWSWPSTPLVNHEASIHQQSINVSQPGCGVCGGGETGLISAVNPCRRSTRPRECEDVRLACPSSQVFIDHHDSPEKHARGRWGPPAEKKEKGRDQVNLIESWPCPSQGNSSQHT